MIRVAFGFLFIGLVLVLSAGSVGASEAYDENWYQRSISVMSTGNISPGVLGACNGYHVDISVEYYGDKDDSCVLGSPSSLRLAQFNHSGAVLYAVAFPYDLKYYEVRGACPIQKCVYSSASDTLLTFWRKDTLRSTGGLFKSFSTSLKKRHDPATLHTYYSFEPVGEVDYIPKEGPFEPLVQSGALSANGKWALLEMRTYGILRVNTETLEARRVVAPGSPYGHGVDPSYDMAISDDGDTIAIGGRRVGFFTVLVNDSCGDSLTESTYEYWTHGSIPCPRVAIDDPGLYDGLLYAASPRFNATGEALSLTGWYQDGTIRRQVLARHGYMPDSRVEYIAMGDSFSSGEGELDDRYYRQNSNQEPVKCHTSGRSYPYVLSAVWSMRTKNLACSGATTRDLVGDRTYSGQKDAHAVLAKDAYDALRLSASNNFQPGVIRQVDFVTKHQPLLATFGIGGNDVGLVGKLTACLSPGTCEWVSDLEKRYATGEEIRSLYPKIKTLIQELKAVAPATKLIAIGYPQILSIEEGSRCDAVISSLLSDEERVFIAESITLMNIVIAAAAGTEGVAFANTELSLFGRDLCGQTDSAAMNGVRLGDDIAPLNFLEDFRVFGAESFHPTPLGHQLVAATIAETFPNPKRNLDCIGCVDERGYPELTEYWGSRPTRYVQQIESVSMAEAFASKGGSLDILTDPMVFEPHSEVVVELRSDPIRLKVGSSAANGSFVTTVTIPDTIPAGYHVLHLYGTSPTGQSIDIYRTVAVVSPYATKESRSFGVMPAKGTVGKDVMRPNQLESHALVLGVEMSDSEVANEDGGIRQNSNVQENRAGLVVAGLIIAGMILAAVTVGATRFALTKRKRSRDEGG